MTLNTYLFKSLACRPFDWLRELRIRILTRSCSFLYSIGYKEAAQKAIHKANKAILARSKFQVMRMEKARRLS